MIVQGTVPLIRPDICPGASGIAKLLIRGNRGARSRFQEQILDRRSPYPRWRPSLRRDADNRNRSRRRGREGEIRDDEPFAGELDQAVLAQFLEGASDKQVGRPTPPDAPAQSECAL